MNSGIKPTDEGVSQFNQLKIDRAYAYMLVSINDACDALVVEKMGEKGAPYQEMVDALPKDDCRYAICDFQYETNENPPRQTNKLILFLWAPVCTKTKRKFTFAATNDALKKSFSGIQKEIQVSLSFLT
jgi:cofilin